VEKQIEIIYSDRAKQRLGEIFDYVAEHFGLEKAIEVTDAIMDSIDKLSENPRLGRPDPKRVGVRTLVVDENTVKYTEAPDQIDILTIRPRKKNKDF
jgi:plasmid stabilization system protein ParE